MENNWSETIEKVRKDLDEAINGLIQKTLLEIDELLNATKNKAQELATKLVEENLTPEKLSEAIQNVLKETLENKKLELEEALKAEGGKSPKRNSRNG
jgi:UDP-N-acetylglucosamine:LPS N-acetylglucosamine transferase